jgi:hypothetical protein
LNRATIKLMIVSRTLGIDLGPEKSPVAKGVAECHSLYNKIN